MSTKSLDLNLYLHQLGINSEAASSKSNKEMKTKLDVNKLHAYEEIGTRLIEDGLLLTALELYAELAEVGHEILCLKQFFSNPGNFEKSATTEAPKFMVPDEFLLILVRSLSQTTLDSLDFAPISEDGDKVGCDRVAVLEFELRKAKETITALRENLTQQVELENASNPSESDSHSSQNNSKLHHNSLIQTAPEPMRAYEQRAINFLVHEYLLLHGYRLTSITFADENAEQDFEDWDDVGLNIERPPDFLTMFRHSHRLKWFSHTTQLNDAGTQTTEIFQENETLDLTLQTSIEESTNSDNASSPFSSITTPNVPNALVNAQNPSSTSKDQYPHSVSSVSLQNSSRGLKDELHQGVVDVRHKFNQLFSKSSSMQLESKQQNFSKLTDLTVKTSDRPSFSLFNK